LSGHSKWSTIKHQKATADQKRGKVFSKVAKAISVAAKDGQSGDPGKNSRLRLVIEQAKSVNMPKQNIQRAIERGLGRGEGAGLETIFYEGFGPERIAVVVECVTDNKNRTTSEVKSFFERGGGNLGAPRSASYLFEKKGLILVEKKKDAQEQILKLIDLGIEDIEEDELLIEVYTKAEELEKFKNEMEKLGFIIKEASLVLKAKTFIPIENKEKKEKILKFLEGLEDLEDTQKVYCNADFITEEN